jgi:hypothetical protein
LVALMVSLVDIVMAFEKVVVLVVLKGSQEVAYWVSEQVASMDDERVVEKVEYAVTWTDEQKELLTAALSVF